MAVIVKYKFDKSIYDNLIPRFNNDFTNYIVTDEVVEGNIVTRVIEHENLKPTVVKFGNSGKTPGNDILCLKEISYLDVSNITSLLDMCANCGNLIKVNTEGWNTSNVTDMYCMFHNCTQLAQLDVSNWDTGKVTNMFNAFNGCSSLTSLDVSNWDTSKVTNMHAMFNGCSKLTQLDVSNWSTSNVTDMYYMFSDCTQLAQLDVSNWDTSKVTTMVSMFRRCLNLTSLDVSNFDTSEVTSMDSMFNECKSLTSLDVSNFDTSKVTNMSSMFNECNSLTQLDVSNWNTSKVSTMYCLFRRCFNVTPLDVSNWDTSNATNMYAMFSACNKLTQLDVSNFDTSKVTNMEYMFIKCLQLTQLDVSNFDTSKITSTISMFEECTSLTSLDVSNFDTSKVTKMDNMFNKCEVKNVGLIYCSKETIDKLANCITSPCNFYVTNKTYTSPNPLVTYVMYREDKKPLLYYNDETQAWEKPVLREWDSIEKHSDGKYYYHKRSGEVVFNGSEDWKDRTSHYASDTQTRFSLNFGAKPCSTNAISLICDKYRVIGALPAVSTVSTDGICTHIEGTTIYITVPKTTLDPFKQQLQANPVTVVYQLAEEKVYECTDLDLVTYTDTTSLIVERGVIAPKTTLKKHQNIANIATILQEKVSALENNVGYATEIFVDNKVETINTEIDNVNTEIDNVNNEINNINTDLIGVSESIEGSWISVDSKDGYLKNVEILGNMIQDANNLEDIRSVGDKVENQELYEIPVLSTGKNLAKLPTNTFELIDGELCFKTNRYTFPYNNYKQNTQYTLTAKGKYFNGYATKLKFEYTDGTYSESSFFTTDLSTRSITSQSGKSVKSAILEQNGDGSYVVGIYVANTVQLEEGTVATPYEPYQGDKITILSPTPLEKIDNVADRIICKDGVWGVEKNITTINLTGNELWSHHTTVSDATSNLFGLNYTRVIPKGQAPSNMSVGIYSNKFLGMDATTLWKVNSQYNERIDMNVNGDIHIRTIKYATVSEFTAWLQETNMFIKYVLAQPQFIPLPYDQQIKLRTFTNKTNISFGCEIEPTLKASIPKSIGASVNSHTEQTDNLSKELQKINNLEESVTSEVVSESVLITVENTNNGYFEDVKLDGRTLVNLAMPVMLNGTTNLVRRDLNNSPITICCNILDSKTQLNGRYIFTDDTKGNDFKIASNGEIGFKSIFLNYDNVSADKIVKGIAMYKVDSSSSLNVENLLILEGDHTQNPPAFFEGLKSVGQDVDEISVLSCKKNLINSLDIYNAIYVDGTSVTGVRNSYKVAKFNISRNVKKFTLTVKPKNGEVVFTGSEVLFGVNDKIDDGNFKSIKNVSNTVTTTFENKNGYILLGYYNVEDTEFYNKIKQLDIQIEEGEIATEYEEHIENKKRILYYNDETQTWERPILRQWDSIEKHADGKYYYHKRSEEIVLDGSEDWVSRAVVNAETTIGFGCPYSYFTDNTGFKIAICDRFVMAATGDHLWHNDKPSFAFNDYLHIRIEKAKLSTQDVQGFKAWLQANNVTVVYQLTEEKVYECTNLDLITYGGETNLMVESGVLNPKVNLKVSKGVGNVVTLLQNKVTMLEQMVYNLMKMLNSQQNNIDE